MLANATATADEVVAVVPSRITELDGIRGTAILLVLVWHYVACQLQTTPGSLAAYSLKMLSMTWVGVDLFFVLSGFLIGGILLDNRRAPNYFTAFYVRRILRIFPLYWLIFAAFALTVAFLATSQSHGADWRKWLFGDPLPLWSYATYFQNFSMVHRGTMGPNWMGVTWSLAIEEQFYILLPPMIQFIPQALLTGLLCVLVVEAPILRTALFFWHPQAGLPGFLLLPARWDALFIGVLGAYAVRQPAILYRLHGSLKMVRAVVLVAGVILAGLLAASQGIGSLGMSAGGHTVVAILSMGLILLATLSNGGMTQALFRHPWLVWLGTVAYGIYLFHQPVAGLLHGALRGQAPSIAGGADAAVTILALCSTLLLAAASWRFFERPFVVLGHRVGYRGKALWP